MARRDLSAGASLIEESPDWAFNILYNGMHQAGQALMLHEGYRTRGEAHHVTLVSFLAAALGSGFGDVVAHFDRMRRSRNKSTYGLVGTITARRAREALNTAEEFVALIDQRVRPGGGRV